MLPLNLFIYSLCPIKPSWVWLRPIYITIFYVITLYFHLLLQYHIQWLLAYVMACRGLFDFDILSQSCFCDARQSTWLYFQICGFASEITLTRALARHAFWSLTARCLNRRYRRFGSISSGKTKWMTRSVSVCTVNIGNCFNDTPEWLGIVGNLPVITR